MATDESFVDHIHSQSGLGPRLTYRRMFGEYALYLDDKVVAFACDNQLYLKPTDEGRALLGTVSEHPAYPGSKLYFRIDEQVDDRDLLRRAFETTARALPPPKAKAKARPRPASARTAKAKNPPTQAAGPRRPTPPSAKTARKAGGRA